MESVTWEQVLAWRMRRQLVEEPGKIKAVELARGLAGVQAQVASSAELAIRIRQAKPVKGEVERALWKDRSLVKTWTVRGTLHYIPADQAGAYLAMCGTVRNWEKPSWQKASGATPKDLEAIAAAAAAALADGSALTREELTSAIVEETGSKHLEELLGSGWSPLLKPLAWWGVLCYGPSQGNRVTFVSPAQALPGWQGLPAIEDAARVVITAFLGAHGPATMEMFDNWLMRKMSRKKDVRAWFAAAEDELTTVEVEGVQMYARADTADELVATEPSKSVRMLGGFDPYVLGTGTGSTYLIPAEHRPDVSRTSGWIAPVVLREGRVVGVWDLLDGEVKVTEFEKIPRAPLKNQIERLQGLL